MPQYMLLIYGDPTAGPAEGSPESQAEFAGWMGYTEQMAQAGVMQAGDALHPVSTATTVRVRGDERVVSDGPFAETRELLAGYYVIDVPDLDAAIEWAAKAPHIAHGSVEVRPVMVFDQG
jgi:hypothetical protein